MSNTKFLTNSSSCASFIMHKSYKGDMAYTNLYLDKRLKSGFLKDFSKSP